MLQEQLSPQGDLGGDIPVPWIPPCHFWGYGTIFTQRLGVLVLPPSPATPRRCSAGRASPESSFPHSSQKRSRRMHPNPQRKCHSSRGERPWHSPWEEQVSGPSGAVLSSPAPAAWHPGGSAEPPCSGLSPANGGFVHPSADSKAGPRAAGPRGPTGPATGQPGAEGESVFSKILPGGAAEQAGKLTEGEGCSQGREWSSDALLHPDGIGCHRGGWEQPAGCGAATVWGKSSGLGAGEVGDQVGCAMLMPLPLPRSGVGFWQEVHFVLVRERHKVSAAGAGCCAVGCPCPGCA